MSASDEEVREFLSEKSELAVKMGGSVIGAAVGAIAAGPPGAMLGAALTPMLEHHFRKLAGEFLGRQLGERQRDRAGAGALMLAAAVQHHLDYGASLRSDDFDKADATGRRPMDEVAEHAIMSMIHAVDERRLPYLANFYAGLYFDEEIGRASVPTLVAIADSLNYRALCILRIVGDGRLYVGMTRSNDTPVAWPPLDHIVAKELFSMAASSIVVAKATNNAHFDTFLSYMDIEPQLIQLSAIGRVLYEKMELHAMPDDDEALVETEQSMCRIAAAPSGTSFPDLAGMILDGGPF